MAKVTPIGLINVLQAKRKDLGITERLKETNSSYLRSSGYTVMIQAGCLMGEASESNK